MTVEELLKTSLLRNADILAGTKGMNRSVSGCTPDTIFQALAPGELWLMPGMLLLHAGSIHTLEDRGYRDSLKKQEIAGLFLLGNQEESREEKEVYGFFNKEQIPLVNLQNVNNALSFTKQMVSLLSKDTNEEQRQEEWLKEVCYSQNLIPSEIVAERYGYVSTVGYSCVIFHKKEGKDENQYQLEYDMRRLKGLTADLFRGPAEPLQFIDGRELVSFLPVPEGEDKRKRQFRLETLVQNLRRGMKERGKFKVSASLESCGLERFSESFRRAKKTASLIQTLGVHEPLSCYENWSMHMLLVREPHAELWGYVRDTLGALCKDRVLLDTLTAYFTSGESLKNTAEFLYIHTNTLKYRLEKIAKLLECDLKNPDTRFRLRMAITVYRYLNK